MPNWGEDYYPRICKCQKVVYIKEVKNFNITSHIILIQHLNKYIQTPDQLPYSITIYSHDIDTLVYNVDQTVDRKPVIKSDD